MTKYSLSKIPQKEESRNSRTRSPRRGLKAKIIVIAGPTASGKTALALRLAKTFNGEVISADSRQVYKGMDIGTGKVTKKERGTVPHHLIDVASPKRQFTVAQYQQLAQKAISDILRRGKLPIICGGTGLYIDTLVYRCMLPAVKPNAKLRKKLLKKSSAVLCRMLEKLDPARAKTIDPHNPRRLIRALEIVLTAKRPVSRLAKKDPKYETLWLGLDPSKKILHRNIHKRLIARMRQGMVAEVKRLKKQGVSSRRLESFGLEYRYINRYLGNKIVPSLSSPDRVEGRLSGLTRGSRILDSRFRGNDQQRAKGEMLRQLESNIHHYAKRQMTWFKRNQDIHWLNKKEKAHTLVRTFLTSSR